MLRELGASEVTVFDMRTDAIAWLATHRPDVAIVDPRLNDGLCRDVVEALAARFPRR